MHYQTLNSETVKPIQRNKNRYLALKFKAKVTQI